MFEWPHTRWMTRTGHPVANADLWKELVRELVKLRKAKLLEIKWGKGHSADNPHNKVVDELAKASAKRPVRPPLVNVAVRRKKSTKKLELGSVEVLGQRLTIRIVTAQYLSTQKVHKYMYEVMSRKSPLLWKRRRRLLRRRPHARRPHVLRHDERRRELSEDRKVPSRDGSDQLGDGEAVDQPSNPLGYRVTLRWASC
jgi:RNase H